jgi:hypothetical protein
VPRQDGTAGSAIHRARAAVGVGGARICAPLELGDRLIDSTGVTADDAVDERGRVVQVFRVGQRDANWPDWYAAYMVAEQSGKELPQ